MIFRLPAPAESLLIFCLFVGLSQQLPEQTQIRNKGNAMRINLTDGNSLAVWVSNESNVGSPQSVNYSCVYVELEDKNQGEQTIRLIFDNEHNLRECQYAPFDDADQSPTCDLDHLPLPRSPIKLKEFRLNSTSELHEKCQEMANRENLIHPVRRTKRGNPFIMPGTRWCGKGNSATREHMFGEEIEADRCCYAHDLCFENIPSFTKRFGYYNIAPYTISHCQCDDEFLECLEHAGTRAANRVGSIYFNFFRIPCFKHTTVTFCKIQSKVNGSCLKYAIKDKIELFHAQKYTSPFEG